MSVRPGDEGRVLSAKNQFGRRLSFWFWLLEGPLSPCSRERRVVLGRTIDPLAALPRGVRDLMADGRVGVPIIREELSWASPHQKGVCRDGTREVLQDIESACESGRCFPGLPMLERPNERMELSPASPPSRPWALPQCGLVLSPLPCSRVADESAFV
jgi:hypothetical protein